MGGGKSKETCTCVDQTNRIEGIKTQIRNTTYNNIIPIINNLNGPIQGFRDKTTALNNLKTKINQLYGNDIPFKLTQNSEYENSVTGTKKSELSQAQKELESSMSVLNRNLRILENLKNGVNTTNQYIDTTGNYINRVNSNNTEVKSRLEQAVNAYHDAIRSENNSLNKKINNTNQDYSVDSQKTNYKTSQSDYMKSFYQFFLIIYYIFVAIMIYLFVKMDIAIYSKGGMIAILIFYPFFIYYIQYYLILLWKLIYPIIKVSYE